MKAKRVTIYRDSRGEWRYRVQAGNWRVIDASEEGFVNHSMARKRARQRWPVVEIVDVP